MIVAQLLNCHPSVIGQNWAAIVQQPIATSSQATAIRARSVVRVVGSLVTLLAELDDRIPAVVDLIGGQGIGTAAETENPRPDLPGRIHARSCRLDRTAG